MRAVGIASLTIFPLFFAGSVLIVHVMASNFASGDLFDGRFGARFAALDLVAVVALGFLFWSGLRWRRKVHLHARYMLATVLFLFMPIFSRLLIQYVPGPHLTPPDFARLPLDVELTSFGTLVFALALAWKQPQHARPWLVTAGFVGGQMILFSTLGEAKPWEEVVRAFSGIPAPLLFTLALSAGAGVSWLGWNSIPPRPARSVQVPDAG